MATADTKFVGSIPEIYDRYFVPLIFEPYAADLARRLALLGPHRILEVAAGTGAVTRAIAAALPQVEIIATDLNPPMIEQARRRQTEERVEWRMADAQALPFSDATFDAVVCQFGMMFFPDKIEAYREARRVLTDGGTYIFSVWDRIEANDFVDVIMQALAEVFPRNPPQFMQRTPHGHSDEKTIRGNLQAAGFTDMTIEAVDAISRADSAKTVAFAYCEGSPLKGEIEERGAPGIDAATARATDALIKRFGSGPVEGKIRAFVVTARK
jgi:ubiquinone/menaquinone biosynthesis C-methylase UbiE